MRIGFVIAMIGGLSGCAWTPKPYATDPLIRTKTALPGDPLAVPAQKAFDGPQPPEPPEERVASRAASAAG